MGVVQEGPMVGMGMIHLVESGSQSWRVTRGEASSKYGNPGSYSGLVLSPIITEDASLAS